MGSQRQQNRESFQREKCQSNLLALFEASEFYDCTFRVGCDLKDPNDFKCHKVILSACSPMFRRMFLSQFKEAKLGPDEPIMMDKIDPLTFESAMKSVYGQEREFKDPAFGMKLYQFAHEMQIESLLDELVEFLKTTKASEIFALFDLYTKTNNQVGLKYCKQILEVDTKEALDSKYWLSCSSESCLEFLKMECLNIIESRLVTALVKWGEFQMQNVGEDTEETLRSKILPGLRQIRFDSITALEAISLCNGCLEPVLTLDEKYALLSSVNTGNWKMMPAGIVSSSKPEPRCEPFLFFPLPYEKSSNEILYAEGISFKINKQVTIVGVKLKSTSYGNITLNKITLFEGFKVLGTSDINSTCMFREEVIIKINAVESLCLNAETDYRLSFVFFYLDLSNRNYMCHTLPADKKSSISGDFVLQVTGSNLDCCVHIQGILFEKKKDV